MIPIIIVFIFMLVVFNDALNILNKIKGGKE